MEHNGKIRGFVDRLLHRGNTTAETPTTKNFPTSQGELLSYLVDERVKQLANRQTLTPEEAAFQEELFGKDRPALGREQLLERIANKAEKSDEQVNAWLENRIPLCAKDVVAIGSILNSSGREERLLNESADRLAAKLAPIKFVDHVNHRSKDFPLSPPPPSKSK